MSLDCLEFENESGTTGFLGGMVSAECDGFNMKLYDLGIKYEEFAADIFYLGENNEITFEEAIKNRLKNTWYEGSTMGNKDEDAKLIDSSHFEFRTAKETSFSEVLMRMYKNSEGIDLDKFKSIVEEFTTSIEYYLKKSKAIYDIPSELNHDIYECGSIISSYYTYITFSIALVEYDNYALLLVRGSNE